MTTPSPMTPLPPACVSAVQEAHDRGCEAEGRARYPLSGEVSAAIARAVLDAFVAGEGSGPWYIAGVALDSPKVTSSGGFMVCRDLGRGLQECAADGLSREQADGFAAVLNYLEAKGE